MNLSASVSLYAGGPGSGCRGSNCGRKRTGRDARDTSGRRAVMVDFDNTIAEHETGSGMSTPTKVIPEGADLVRRLKSAGYRVIVFTARRKRNHGIVRRFLAKNKIAVDGVTNQKYPAIAYVDNRAVQWNRDADAAMRRIKALE